MTTDNDYECESTWRGESIYDNYKSFVEHIKKIGFHYLSEGSFRMVFERKGVVIKIPMYVDGLMDNRVEHKAYHTYFNGPSPEGIYMAPCRLLPNGALMMKKLRWGTSYSVPAWGDLVDGTQVGPYKGRVVAYDYGLDMTQRFTWEREWGRKSKFFYSKEWRSQRPHIDAHIKKLERKERKMKKEEMNKELGDSLNSLREQATSMNKLVESLQLTLRNGGDVSFSTVEEAKRFLDGIKNQNPKQTVEKIHRVLKARAQARIKEL